MSVACIDPLCDPRWRALLDRPSASLFHSPAWLGALADAYGLQPRAFVVLDEQGQAVAGLPFCRVDDLLGHRVISLPFSDYCDPLVGAAADWPLLFEAVARLSLPARLAWREISDMDAGGRLEVINRTCWHGIDLGPELEQLWGHLAPSSRRAVRKAERENVRVETLADEVLIPEFMRLHVRLRKWKYRLLAPPVGFFEAIRSRLAATGDWHPLAAVQGGRVIAVTIYLRWRDTLYYKFNASALGALASRPNDALLWEGIRLGKRLGCRRLDLGRSDDEQPGLIRFKRQYGAEQGEIRSMRYVPPGGTAPPSEARALLDRMTELLTDPAVPDEISARVGAQLYRFFA